MVEIRRVSRRYSQTLAVDNASLALQHGDFLTIVGPSGCGKTTLLRMIAGFDAPTEGSILINGQDVSAVPPFQRSIGMVFQKLALFPHMTALQNVAFPLKMRRFEAGLIKDRALEFLRLVQLEHLADRRPHQLSGGQQQRVAIARALSFGPDLLLLDEPLSALDRKLREEMQLEFRRIQQELGVTTINVTHDQREAMVMSDRMIVMDEGVIQQSDTPRAIYNHPQNRFVAGFLGATSQFRATVESVGQEGRLRVRVADVILEVRGSADRIEPGMKVDCAIRAEQLSLIRDGDSRCDNSMSGVVIQSVFEGDRMVHEIAVPDMENARFLVFEHTIDGNIEHAAGSQVTLGWDTASCLAFPLFEH